jgi:diacylglycerol kinase family enzyme
MQRLIIVYNPHSSQYIHVKEELFPHLTEIKKCMVGKFAIKKAPFEENLKALKNFLKNGDIVIAAGGDATAAVSANAILESGKDVTLGVLPYGNFNDLARTLGAKKLSDMINVAGDARRGTPKTFLACKKFWGRRAAGPASTRQFYPLDIIVNGKHWRYATCYVTMGMTAEAVELFDDPKIRKNLQKGHKSSWRSYIHLMKWYFKNRHKKLFIPEFKINGKLQPKKTSDYAAVNGKSMCRVMKGGEDYLVPIKFRSMTDRLANFWRLSKLMAKSILVRTPGTETKGDVLEFIKPSTVSLQAEGEYKTFKGAKTIEVIKTDKSLKVFHK